MISGKMVRACFFTLVCCILLQSSETIAGGFSQINDGRSSVHTLVHKLDPRDVGLAVLFAELSTVKWKGDPHEANPLVVSLGLAAGEYAGEAMFGDRDREPPEQNGGDRDTGGNRDTNPGDNGDGCDSDNGASRCERDDHD